VPSAHEQSPELWRILIAMDPLSDLLRVVRLDGAFFYAVEAAEPWIVESAAATALKPQILPGAEHLIAYHILTGGRCYARLIGEEPVELLPGDVLVFPHGDANVMSSGRDLRAPGVKTSFPDRYPHAVVLGNGGPPAATFVCGFLGCDRRPFNPLLASLPRLLVMRGMSSEWLAGFAGRVTDGSQLGRPGAAGVLTRLAELMFVELLRRYLQELPPGQTGWLAGLRDEVVGRVLALLHERPAHGWTLEELARGADSSRTNMTKRFTNLVGKPPMQYLTQWRMQVAANLLSQSGAKVSAIASEVGYDSEAAFSRAFKKTTGMAPGAWRRSRTSGGLRASFDQAQSR
jgi:AraC-like DNA-binding protein